MPASPRLARESGERSESRPRYSSLQARSGGAATTEQEQPIDWFITSLLFLFPAFGGLLFGYDIGATSGAIVSLKSAATSGTTWYELSPLQSGLAVSSGLLGALAGSGGAFAFGEKLGRRRELLLAAACYGIATLVTASAGSYPQLLAGRTLYGLGIGFAMHAAPAYIAETTPARVRGLLISLKEGFIVVGILLGYLASSQFIDSVGGWRYMYGLSLLPAILLGAGMLWLPESPRWLLLSGASEEEATANCCRARGQYGRDEGAVRSDVSDMASTMQASRSSTEEAGFSALFKGRNLRPLTIGMSLMLFQQITGQPSVLYYATEIFEKAGFASQSDASKVSVGLGFFKLVMTGLAVLTVDSWGRRPLLLLGVSLLTVALAALSAVNTFLPASSPTATWTSVVALLLYVGAYQASFGPISWLMVGEVFPLAVRGPAAALASLTNFGSNFLVSLVLPTVQDSLGLGTTYAVFAGIGIVSLITIYNIVPETRGKTLEEIEALWDKDQ
ncbi:hypothetical protein WJX74_007979 [Apatococcus lobatus]|uniref:Major facilitator superfamily (MFS) profile domain-containing protein n=2 Tax=Apatococcus TaxID=904362 RepID=A0AAW1TBW7_9CHLO